MSVFEEAYPDLQRAIVHYLHTKPWVNQWLCEEDIEDVTEATLGKILSKADTYTGQSDGEAWNWIAKIGKNLAMDLLDRIKKEEGYTLQIISGADGEEEAPEETIDRITGRSWNEADAFTESLFLQYNWLKFYEQLTPQEKKVFSGLAGGMQETEIAQKLRITRPRVTQLRIAIQKKWDRFKNNL